MHHQCRAVLGRQAVDGLLEHLAQLALQRALVHAIGPVVHRLEVAVVVERRQHVVEGDLGRLLPARAQLLVGRVGGDPVDPRAERRLALEHADLAGGRPQRVLGGLLGVLAGAGDPHGQAVDAIAEALDQPLGGLGLLGPQRRHQIGVDVDPRSRRHAAHDRTS